LLLSSTSRSHCNDMLRFEELFSLDGFDLFLFLICFLILFNMLIKLFDDL
jgi:hypothetical protein